MQVYKPIFIVGSPNSGTSLLYELMASHKELAWISQFDLRDWFSKEYLQFLFLRRRILRLRNWKDFPNDIGSRFTASFEIPFEGGHFWGKFIPKSWTKPEDFSDEKCKELRNAIQKLIIKKNKKRFLAKYPRNSVNMDCILKAFPDSIFINVIRDGRAVVDSMISRAKLLPKQYFGTPLKQSNQMSFNMLERHARQWLEINEEIQRVRISLKSNQYFELKYEDLVSDPKNCIKNIFNFCELSTNDIFEKPIKQMYHKGQIEYLSGEPLKNRNAWKTNFTNSELSELNKIMGKLLERFEYF